MKDPKYIAYLQHTIEVDKETIVNGQLTLDEVIATAQNIKKTEAQIERMLNPRTRKPKIVETPISENPVGETE